MDMLRRVLLGKGIAYGGTPRQQPLGYIPSLVYPVCLRAGRNARADAGLPCWRVWNLLHCRASRCQLQYVPLAWCWLYIASCHVSVGWLQAEYMLLNKGC
jgi:hypothetical protein